MGHTDTQGEGHVISEAKVGVMLPQAKECSAYRQPPKVRRLAWDRLFTLESQEGANLPTPWFHFWPPEL